MQGRQSRLNQIIPPKINTLENMKNMEPMDSFNFFKKYNKKIVRSNLHLTKKRKSEN